MKLQRARYLKISYQTLLRLKWPSQFILVKVCKVAQAGSVLHLLSYRLCPNGVLRESSRTIQVNEHYHYAEREYLHTTYCDYFCECTPSFGYKRHQVSQFEHLQAINIIFGPNATDVLKKETKPQPQTKRRRSYELHNNYFKCISKKTRTGRQGQRRSYTEKKGHKHLLSMALVIQAIIFHFKKATIIRYFGVQKMKSLQMTTALTCDFCEKQLKFSGLMWLKLFKKK